ncbi:unnamed protein product [Pseudo-nitzschia multistriata]|uniref:Uncharacterized protein n=1 Tax=Pseudo-nitzschia multistriata TaxID=183589 RepID=A0A448ZHB3_9STRA|nr:unnamed protein product [Pseudo-nitzschia multistriata]
MGKSAARDTMVLLLSVLLLVMSSTSSASFLDKDKVRSIRANSAKPTRNLSFVHSSRHRCGNREYGFPKRTDKIAATFLSKLRGGSNKSESVANGGANESTTDNNGKRTSSKAKENRNRNKNKYKKQLVHKDENKNKRSDSNTKNKRKVTTDEEEEVVDEENGVDCDHSLGSRENKSDTSSIKLIEQNRPSKLFLVDPFRMNELARYEASIEQEVETNDENDDAEEETTPIAARKEMSHESKNEEDDEERDRRNKKGKKKWDRTKAATVTEPPTNEGSKSGEEGEPLIASDDGEVSNGLEEDPRIEGDEQTTKSDSVTTDDSNSFWWVDVWTQHLSDPEDFEGEHVGDADVEEGIDIDVALEIVDKERSGSSESNGKFGIEDGSEVKEKRSKGRKKKNKGDRSTSENIKLSKAPDGNITVSSDIVCPSVIEAEESSTKENAATSTADENAKMAVSELDVAPSYLSSGAWITIDNLLTIGLASKYPALRFSRKIRTVRKLSARITGLHGVMSGKPIRSLSDLMNGTDTDIDTNSTNIDHGSMYSIKKQIAAIDKARERVELAEAEEKVRRRKRSFFGFRVKSDVEIEAAVHKIQKSEDDPTSDKEKIEKTKVPQKSPEEMEEEYQRMERVREIDTLISEGQRQLAELICEKDVLQRRPNPLFNYTTKETITRTEVSTNDEAVIDGIHQSGSQTDPNATKKVKIQATRKIIFPPDDLVAEYLDMMLSTRRLTKMNHTQLWREGENAEDDDEESIGDDLFTPSADVHRLYQRSPRDSDGNGSKKGSRNGKKGGGGSWLLRQSIGNGPTLGEKIGQAAETAAYKAVTNALMSFLARLISSLHGINVMKHSDIRLVLEQSPDLPPVPKDGIIRGDHSNYAEETIKTVMRQKSRRSKKRSSKRRLSETLFVQQEAVTETLLSHVQISAPLLKLFPLAWQRALLGNIIALSCAIISDFVEGLHFQILGHELSFSFRPITEVDMARHFQMAGGRFNQRRYKAAEFEAAVQATAEDLKEELKFLDSWHERALGSGVLRTQIADMIARIVLTLTDDVLSGARMDLWSVQAGGPRMLAGLEHRIEERS